MRRARQLHVPALLSLLMVVVLLTVSVAQAAPPAAGGNPAGSSPGIRAGAHLQRQVAQGLHQVSPGTSKVNVPARQTSDALLASAVSTFSINYIPEGTAFYSWTCQARPPEAVTAFDGAAAIWGSLVKSSVPISVDACWTSLSAGNPGGAWPFDYWRDFPGAPQTGTWYPFALADALAGVNLEPTTPDIEGVFGNGLDWYFGTSGSPAAGQYDFMTYALRELGYGLGYEGTLTVEGTAGTWGWYGHVTSPYYPDVYDRLVVNGSGQSLIGGFPNNSTQLAAQLKSNNVYFDGAQAKAANGGNRPKLYAPATWGQYYLSYLDPIYDGTPNALMTLTLAQGEVVHDPGPMGLAILNDLGWSSVPTVAALTPASGNLGASVAINGTNLLGATSVTFNGAPATFTNFSAAEIIATVPAGAATGPVSVTTPGGTATSAASFTVTDTVPPQVTLLPQPVRIVDTRSSSGFQGAGQSLTGYTSFKRFTLAGEGGVPANATAVLVNLTAVGYSADGWLSAYPACTTRPATSNLNFDTVENAIANFAIVKLGTAASNCLGAIDVTGANGTNVIVDVVGYLVATTSNQVALLGSPQRIVDTRSGSGFQGAGSALNGYGANRRYDIAGLGGVPSNATAVLVNLTAVGYSADGWLAAWPACATRPVTSNVNFDTVENAIANFAIVKLGTAAGCEGKIDVTGAFGTNVIVDVTGYLVATPNDQIVLLDSPKRIVDTRTNSGFQGAGAPLTNTSSPKSYILGGQGGQGGVPADAKGVIANLTTVGYSSDGWIAAYPTGGAVPATSSVNYDTQENAIANTAIVGLGTGGTNSGKVNLVASSQTNAIIDVSAYLR